MTGTPLLQPDGTHIHEALRHVTPLSQADDTNIHEAMRHGALAVDQFPCHWRPNREPPLKAPPPGYNLNCPPPKWGAPHQSARQPPPIVLHRAEQSLEQLHQEFLRTQRLWLARLLPFKAPPMKAPPFGKAPPPPQHNGGNRWTTYTYAALAGPPPAMTSSSSSDTDNTYNAMPGLVDDQYRRRSRSPSTISRDSTCTPSSTATESVASRYDCPNTSE